MKKVVSTSLLVAILMIVVLPLQIVMADTERQSPDAILVITNLNPNNVAYIQDDPDSPDGNWLVASGNNVNTDVRVSFPTPTGNPTVGADLQEFKAWVRQYDEGQSGTPDVRIELWENGVLIRAGSDESVTLSGHMVTFTWNANEIAVADGSLVELKVVGTKSGGSPSSRNTVDVGAIEWNVDYTAGASAPTVTTQVATNIETTTATGNGNITATGGANATVRGFEWDIDTGAPYANDVSEVGDFGIGAYSLSLTGLPTGTTIYYRAYATNSGGTGYGGEQTFLTKSAPPTNIVATDGDHTDKVVITWTKSTGATGYKVYRDAGLIDTIGDVATYDDTGADVPTITPGTASATDGSSTTEVTLSLAGESANNGTTHIYKLRATNVTGDSTDSATDGGNMGVGALTYQWQRSTADSDAAYGNIVGAITDPYSDTAAPAPTVTAGTGDASDGTSSLHVVLTVTGETGNDGDGRYYRCVLDATGAVQQTSTVDRGYRGTTTLTYQWLRSEADFDAAFSNIDGATTDPYNDTDGVQTPNGRWYYTEVSMVGATTQDTTHNRGFKAEGGSPTVVTYKPTVNGVDVTLNGEITNTGVPGDDDIRGFVWDTVTHANPGNVVPGASAYAFSWTESGSFGVGVFDYSALGLLEETMYMVRACAHNGGWGYGDEICFMVGVEGKVYLEIRPFVTWTTVQAHGKPGAVQRGVFQGFSLPIYNNDNEELFYTTDVPDRWDGETNLIVHLDMMLSNAGEDGNNFLLQLDWQQATVDVDVVPATFSTTLFMERTVYTNDQYQSYECFALLDYDIDATDPVEVDDLLCMRLRRVTATAPQLDGEVIILHLGVQFARGDLLGDPGDILTEGGTSMVLLALIFLPLGLTIAMFWTRERMLGFPCGIFWAILGGYAYTLSEATWDIYYLLFFASAFGMVIFTILAAYGLRERRDTIAERELEKGEGDYIDEGTDEGEGRKGEPKMSKRTKGIRARVKERREKADRRMEQ